MKWHASFVRLRRKKIPGVVLTRMTQAMEGSVVTPLRMGSSKALPRAYPSTPQPGRVGGIGEDAKGLKAEESVGLVYSEEKVIYQIWVLTQEVP